MSSTVSPLCFVLILALATATSCVSSGRGPSRRVQPAAPLAHDTSVDPEARARFARLALDAIHREYPNKIGHVMKGPEDLGEPHDLHPIFYGSFDWHSSVHGHWLLARLCRLHPEASYANEAKRALAKSFTDAKARGEVAYFDRKDRRSYERPYGLAWLLQLSSELHAWDDPDARRWAATLDPLVDLAARRLLAWFPKLTHPIRTGEHSQTAFAMGLILDWARERGRSDLERVVIDRGTHFYLRDRGWNFAFEPGGQDFLSPGLAQADFMRRILDPGQFASYLRGLLPGIPSDGSSMWLLPAVVTDISDGKLAHLDGLNLSRAWMLDGIASSLPKNDPRVPSLRAAQKRHAASGLASVTGEDYAGGHWLASFAVYLVTRRGLTN